MLTRLLFIAGWAAILVGTVLWLSYLALPGWIGLLIAAIGAAIVLMIWTDDTTPTR